MPDGLYDPRAVLCETRAADGRVVRLYAVADRVHMLIRDHMGHSLGVDLTPAQAAQLSNGLRHCAGAALPLDFEGGDG